MMQINRITLFIFCALIFSFNYSHAQEIFEESEEAQSKIVIQKPLLLVTHVTGSFKEQGAELIVDDVNLTIDSWKKLDYTVVQLIDVFKDPSLLTKDKNPDYLLRSEAGEHYLNLETNHVVVLGGYAGRCHAHSTEATISRYLKSSYYQKTRQPLFLYLPIQAIFCDCKSDVGIFPEKRLDKNECFSPGKIKNVDYSALRFLVWPIAPSRDFSPYKMAKDVYIDQQWLGRVLVDKNIKPLPEYNIVYRFIKDINEVVTYLKADQNQLNQPKLTYVARESGLNTEGKLVFTKSWQLPELPLNSKLEDENSLRYIQFSSETEGEMFSANRSSTVKIYAEKFSYDPSRHTLIFPFGQFKATISDNKMVLKNIK